MNKTFLKGLFMTAIVFIATSLSAGFPESLVQWQLLGITTLGTVLAYIGQAAIFPSTSVFGTMNLRDLLKGGILAVASFLSSVGATVITGTKIDWLVIGKSVFAVITAYFIKQFATKPSGIPPTK